MSGAGFLGGVLGFERPPIGRYDHARAYELLFATADSPAAVTQAAEDALEDAGQRVDVLTGALLLVAGEVVGGTGDLDAFVRPPHGVLTAATDAEVTDEDVEQARQALMAMTRTLVQGKYLPTAAQDVITTAVQRGRDLELAVAVARLIVALLPAAVHPVNQERLLEYARQVRAGEDPTT